MPVSDRYVMASRANSRRAGRRRLHRRDLSHAIALRSAGRAGAAETTTMMPMMFRLLILAMRGPDRLHPLRRRSRERLARAAPSCPTAGLLPELDRAEDLTHDRAGGAGRPADRPSRRRRDRAALGRRRFRASAAAASARAAPQPFERAVAEAVEPGLRPEQHQRPHREHDSHSSIRLNVPNRPRP